jgi:sulfur-oxidizing protein SoxX
MNKNILLAAGGIALVAGCASMSSSTTNSAATSPELEKEVTALMRADFKSKGPATVERVTTRDEAQKLCSDYPSGDVPKAVAEKIEKAQQANIKYPADGKYLGDWKEGEKIAQLGRGMQFSDQVGAANGGNCYACHQLSKQEISFGNIGPSLHNYGKIRGNSEAIVKYTWGKIWNAQAFTACSNMPRFGHNGILTETQVQHVMALLLDPKSPVNQ